MSSEPNNYCSHLGRGCWSRENTHRAQVNVERLIICCCRYVKGKLPVNKPSTIGVEFATKNVELHDGHGVVKAQIWDTGNSLNPFISAVAGQERYKAITSAHYRRAVGALVVYDVTKAETFTNAMKWMEELRASAEPECVIYLVGNQVDRVEINPALRQVPYEQAKTFADKNRLFFEETSALTNARVTDVFENLLNRILNPIIINFRNLFRPI